MTPACAGTTSTRSLIASALSDDPRVCGDDQVTAPIWVYTSG